MEGRGHDGLWWWLFCAVVTGCGCHNDAHHDTRSFWPSAVVRETGNKISDCPAPGEAGPCNASPGSADGIEALHHGHGIALALFLVPFSSAAKETVEWLPVDVF